MNLFILIFAAKIYPQHFMVSSYFLYKLAYYINSTSDLRRNLDHCREFVTNSYKRIENLEFLIKDCQSRNLEKYRKRVLELEAEILKEEELIGDF